MGDIENGSLFTCMMMRCQHTHIGVLNRHGITSKGNHLTTMLDMEIIQSGLFDRLIIQSVIFPGGGISNYFKYLAIGSSSITALCHRASDNGGKRGAR